MEFSNEGTKGSKVKKGIQSLSSVNKDEFSIREPKDSKFSVFPYLDGIFQQGN
ncbi:hypothetical protein SLEP1_g45391 [Rubroshorea leprosula]|uniref:Uncharacterized protein n=1 Tax=Rubroshorea leprosula TaxID=152421 RepID=A0AAV5LJ13_9ROSI|nr:hypothetical protein SLEP1_g45391 [Rubroshorea leprosula]